MTTSIIYLNTMNMSIDWKLTILNLKMLGQIDTGTKLNTRGNEFTLDDCNIFQGIYRYYRRDDRCHTLTKIEQLVRNVQTLVNHLIDGKNVHTVQNGFPYITIDKIALDIENGMNGLEKLRDTYNHDKTTSTKLEIEISCLKDVLLKIKPDYKTNDVFNFTSNTKNEKSEKNDKSDESEIIDI